MSQELRHTDIEKTLKDLDEFIQNNIGLTSKELVNRINFINWMISELMNGLDGFDLPEDNDKDADIDIQDRWDTIDNYRKEFGMEFPEDMSDEEWRKLIKQFELLKN